MFSQEKSEKSRWAKIMTNSMGRRVLAMILAVVMLFKSCACSHNYLEFM